MLENCTKHNWMEIEADVKQKYQDCMNGSIPGSFAHCRQEERIAAYLNYECGNQKCSTSAPAVNSTKPTLENNPSMSLSSTTAATTTTSYTRTTTITNVTTSKTCPNVTGRKMCQAIYLFYTCINRIYLKVLLILSIYICRYLLLRVEIPESEV